ncbi:hypothetical protein MPSEU_000251400 [Mayamaea pseudoterrestris]|nr:hypothetical protein MPSEU_000251400 [Mayamaea pseudoterrestris]
MKHYLNSFHAVASALIALAINAANTDRLEWHEKKPEEWYQRYDAYPPYCSTPSQMESRSIPPLDNSKKYGSKSRLAHVTAVIRHGARTPWTSDLHCWNGYSNADTGTWSCDLTTWLAPPSPKVVEQQEEESFDTSDSGAMFLFEKHYDSLVYPKNNLTNLLNGTCQMGQLLLQGYEQQITNGRHFRKAYVYDSSNGNEQDDTTQPDARMQLIDVAVNDETTDDDGIQGNSQPWSKDKLRLRADDDQRTIMSGQVLLRGMFEQEIDNYFAAKQEYPLLPLHTADRSRDILGANDKVCPRLLQMETEFRASQSFRSFMTSLEAKQLLDFQRNVLQLPHDQKMDAIDCLMTTICTDRTLPDAVNDYTSDVAMSADASVKRESSGDENRRRRLHDEDDYGENLFQRLYDWDVKGYVLQQTDNDAAYAKLSMSFLWAEIMEGINKVLENKQDTIKLSLVSGHDTTIMPLLMSLGPRVFDRKWTPYASHLVLEIHKLEADRDLILFKSDFAFRLLYNGKILTPLMDGCSEDLQLCDAQVLVAQVQPFATRELNCQVDKGFVALPRERTSDWTRTPSDDVAVVVLSLLSALVGSLLTYLYMARVASTRGYTKQRRQSTGSAGDGLHRNSLTLQVSGDNIDDSEGQFA